MYAKISYNADEVNTPTKILEHITELLTGTITIGGLTGGNIDSGNSSIDVTYHTPAYVLHDDVSATQKIFKIPVHDDGASFIYFELFVSSNDIDMKLWEEWNATTHIGTGGVYYTTTGFEFVSLTSYATSAFTLYYTVTPTHCLARSVYASGTVKYCRGFMQYERRELWDTVANGHKPAVLTKGDTLFTITLGIYALPHRRSDGSIYSLTTAQLYAATAYGSSQYDAFTSLLGNSSSNARGLDASNASIHNMYEFGFSYLSIGERFLTGKVFDMYVATYSNGAFGDTVSIDSNTYIIWEASTVYRMAIRKG